MWGQVYEGVHCQSCADVGAGIVLAVCRCGARYMCDPLDCAPCALLSKPVALESRVSGWFRFGAVLEDPDVKVMATKTNVG